MAPDIGARIRNAREQRGLTLRDIANTTKISAAALDAIEHNDFDRLPGGVFRRAYVRTFAAEVGLNADEVTREYRARFETEVPAGPLLREEPGCTDRTRALHWLASALAVGFAILIYWFVIAKFAERGRGSSNEDSTSSAIVARLPEELVPPGESDDPEEVAFANAAAVPGMNSERDRMLACGDGDRRREQAMIEVSPRRIGHGERHARTGDQ